MSADDVASQLPNYRRIEIWVAVGTVLFLLVLIESIRRRRLKERYALLWFPTALVVIILTVKREWLEGLSYTLGIHHAPSALLLVLVAFAMLILFHFSTVLSRLLDGHTAMAQRIGLLDARCRALQREVTRLQTGESDPSGEAGEEDGESS